MQCAGELYHSTEIIVFYNLVVKACIDYTLVHSRELNFKQDNNLFEY